MLSWTLVNELAILFKKLNLNTKDVLNTAATKWNFHNYKPGLVGGHCIGVDPYYLTFKAKEIGFKTDLITFEENVLRRKPHPDIYNYAIKKLDLDCSSSISIENTIENCKSSTKAKLPTLFYPGEYTFFRDSDNFTHNIFKSVEDFFKES